MTQNIFNPRLFWQGMKQLRIIGFIGLIAPLALNIIIFVLGANSVMDLAGKDFQVEILSALQSSPLTAAVPFIFVPLMVLFLFHFLNNRAKSDFYHAIPVKRKCLYLSFLGAILAWMVIMLAANLAAALILLGIYNQYVTFNVTSMFLYMGCLFATGLLMIGAIGIAMALTGNIFTNLVLSAIILFLPRLLLLVAIMAANSGIPYVRSVDFWLLNPSYNTVFGSVNAFLYLTSDAMSLENVLTSVGSMLYTSVLGILYIIFAMLLFIRRKSECAGFSAINNKIMAFIRCGFTLIICTVPLVLIFEGMQYNYYEMDAIIIFYAIALIAYIVLELVANRSFKSLLRSWSSLVIIAAMNGILLLAMVGLQSVVSSYLWTADEIDYATTVWDDEYANQFYLKNKLSTFPIEDPEILSALSDTWKECIDTYQTDPDNYSFQYRDTERMTIEFHNGFQTCRRYLPVASALKTKMLEYYQSNEEFKQDCLHLPDMEENNTGVYFSSDLSNWSPSDEQLQQIYRSLQEEFSALDFADVFQFMISYDDFTDILGPESGSPNSWYELYSIEITTEVGLHAYREQFEITPYTFPKTYQLISDLILQSDVLSSDMDALNKALETAFSGKGLFAVAFTTLDMGGVKGSDIPWQSEGDSYFNTLEIDNRPRLDRLLNTLKQWEATTDDKPITLLVNINWYSYDQHKYYVTSVSKEQLAELAHFIAEETGTGYDADWDYDYSDIEPPAIFDY